MLMQIHNGHKKTLVMIKYAQMVKNIQFGRSSTPPEKLGDYSLNVVWAASVSPP